MCKRLSSARSGHRKRAPAASGLSGNDHLLGGPGADTLLGGLGDDLLDGFDRVAGNNSIDGSLGTDTCDSDAGDAETACEI